MAACEIAISVDHIRKVSRLGAKDEAETSFIKPFPIITRRPVKKYQKYGLLCNLSNLDFDNSYYITANPSIL